MAPMPATDARSPSLTDGALRSCETTSTTVGRHHHPGADREDRVGARRSSLFTEVNALASRARPAA